MDKEEKKKSDSGFSMSAECLEKRTRSPIGLFRFGGSVCRRHKRSAVIFEKRKKEKGEKIVNENTEWAEIALCQHRTTSKEKIKKKKQKCGKIARAITRKKKKETRHVFSPRARSLQSPTTDGEIAEDGINPSSIRSSVICLGTLFP
jgi:hypothetical protein